MIQINSFTVYLSPSISLSVHPESRVASRFCFGSRLAKTTMQNFHLSSMINMSMTSCCTYITGQQIKNPALYLLLDNQAHRRMEVLCSASKGSRGFSPRSKKEKANKVKAPSGDADLRAQTRKSISKPPDNTLNQEPGSVIQLDGKSGNKLVDREFEERLEAVRSMALKQKKKEENKQYDIIDYDAAVEPKQSTIGLGTKVGVGVAVVVFGLLFAFGDFLPYISDNSNNEAITAVNTLTEEEKSSLKARLQQYEAKLSISMQDPVALEGAAVTLSELGDYDRASSFLEKLSKEKPMDPEVYRLLGEVRYKLKDYEGSVAAYKSSASVAAFTNFDVLRGLTNALLAANKPDEAVQVLLASRDRLGTRNSSGDNMQAPSKSGNLKMEMQEIDPIQVELLLGKAYTEWDRISDAISVYDRLISMHSDDFRGYLAKGILLKQIGKVGDAERMFIQARFFAPEKAKALVDRYSRQ